MKSTPDMSRRVFFKISVGGAGLAIGFGQSSCTQQDGLQGASRGFSPSAYLTITPDGQVTLKVIESEMGQGVWTSLPMLIAEELEIDLASVRVEQAPLLPEFRDNITWGSGSIRKAWIPLRKAGAIAREMLISAAAEIWQVPVHECMARNGSVVHKPSGRVASYGDLAVAAARLPIPEEVPLKDPEEYTRIGTSTHMLDGPAKSMGTTVFGMDVKLEGMLTATVVHCPIFGGILRELDETEALNVPGVRHVVRIDTGVAVVADHFWAAKKGRDALKLQWDPGSNAELSSASIRQSYARAMQGDAEVIKQLGEKERSPVTDTRTIQATYEAPFQAHATMEPMCCTADVRDGSCDIWAPTQAPGYAQAVASRYLLSKPERALEKIKLKLTGDSLEDIRVHTTFLGGGFGRRYEQDYVAEAIQISQAVAKPVRLIWSREEDIQHDYYRPYTRHRVTAGMNAEGRLASWAHRVVGPGGHFSFNGANLPYATDHYRLDYIEAESPVPIGFWRSVGSSHNVFVIESFIDELAAAMGDDPYAFRRRLLAGTPRLRTVLDLAARKAGWGEPLPEERFRGVAVNNSHGSYVAQVAEISFDRHLRVHRVVCAVDCGQVINPDTVRAQMEGSIAFGLSACIKGAITIKQGRVVQSNFHDFPLLRMDEMPDIETHIVASNESPGGIGEPGVPPLAPAVANAVYAATGVRVRKLPIMRTDLVTG